MIEYKMECRDEKYNLLTNISGIQQDQINGIIESWLNYFKNHIKIITVHYIITNEVKQ